MSKNINDTLIEFLTNLENKNKILVLKGKWGVGKTHFWKNFFEDNNLDNKTKLSDDEKQIISNVLPNYSYVSLFGISDINELKNKIFTSSSPIKLHSSIWNGSITKEKTFISAISLFILFFIFTPSLKILGVMALLAFLIAFWFDHFKHLSFWINLFKKETYKNIDKHFFSLKNAGKFLDHINKLAIIKRYIGDSTNFISNNYIKDMLICFDDIERIDSKFPIETLMGYADELAQQKNCKIILIFNEDELENKQKETFNKYREKIVDIELTYAPILNEQLEIAFGNKLTKYPIITKVINEQEHVNIIIKNIRVLTKINQIIDDFIKISPTDLDALITEDFIKRTIYLSHCFYEMNSKVPFDIIKTPDLIAEYQELNTGIKGTKEAQEERAKEHEKNKFKGKYDQSSYDELMLKAQQLYINQYSVFTEEIIHTLEHGFWNQEELKLKIQNEIKRINIIEKQNIAQNNITKAWDLYRNTYHDNLSDIINAFYDIITLPENYQYLSLIDFLSCFDSYYFFKKMKNKNTEKEFQLIDVYIESHKEFILDKKNNMLQHIDMHTNILDLDTMQYVEGQIKKLKSEYSSMDEFVLDLKPNTISSEQRQYLNSLTEDEYYDWIMSKDNDPNLYYTLATIIGLSTEKNTIPLRNALIRIGKQNELNKDRILKAHKLNIEEY
ncbi:P-loop NTPase fold protein [Wohlfahrtiimonas larvae]|uniref:KAP NTPase domain-containing protein n=1 Tax=Wohlfahrtiimonas larvae TaxID=1157986 RepID=A0ABP9MTW2_9GAMM|nr:P-loop NTPase fold protein [Wohlfahrtiimonas larvae]